jgi:hypothetical protein
MKARLIAAAAAAASLTSFALFLLILIPHSVEAIRDSWRHDAHSRSIDIDVDICVRCTSDVPGPQGPPGEKCTYYTDV